MENIVGGKRLCKVYVHDCFKILFHIFIVQFMEKIVFPHLVRIYVQFHSNIKTRKLSLEFHFGFILKFIYSMTLVCMPKIVGYKIKLYAISSTTLQNNSILTKRFH